MAAEIKQRRNKVVNKTKGRREKADRRQKCEKLITQLDRRNIEDRRNTKDRRLSKQKTFLFPVTQQGITIKALKDEKVKLTKLIGSIITNEDSSSCLVIVDLLKDAYFALRSQESKEDVLFQWYKDSKSYFKGDLEYITLISQLNFILKKEIWMLRLIFFLFNHLLFLKN